MRQAFQSNNRSLLFRTAGISLILCLTYSCSFVAVDKIMGLSYSTSNTSFLAWIAAALIVFGFSSMSLLQRKFSQSQPPTWVNKLYIHAINGFYVEALIRQRFEKLPQE